MATRVLFLMSDTGGGHRASARALGEALYRLHGPAIDCEAVDLFADYAHWPLCRIPQIYRPLVERHGWLWRLLWAAGARQNIWRSTVAIARTWHADRFRGFLAGHPADLVVSVHPLLNHAPLREVRRRLPGTPFVTVVTDLATGHPVWYARDVDLLCAPCVEVQRAARAAGIAPARIRLTGLPISLDFVRGSLPREAARHRAGLANRPTVLIIGGGEGMGPILEITQAVAGRLCEVGGQAVVICGRNAALHQKLASIDWPAPVRVLGFVQDVFSWMSAADCLVTKAGPGTIAEGLACGLPIVLSGFIFGQEAGNVDYVLDHGVGAFAGDPAEIARIVQDWLRPGNPAMLEMQTKARALARPRAALEIAEILSELFLQ